MTLWIVLGIAAAQAMLFGFVTALPALSASRRDHLLAIGGLNVLNGLGLAALMWFATS